MFPDWDMIILNNARSRDSKELGNVIAIDDDSIILNRDNIEFKSVMWRDTEGKLSF
jgi:hypothetical protein